MNVMPQSKFLRAFAQYQKIMGISQETAEVQFSLWTRVSVHIDPMRRALLAYVSEEGAQLVEHCLHKDHAVALVKAWVAVHDETSVEES
jgi:hypothetical protein